MSEQEQIAIIEDSPEILQLLSKALSEADYQIHT